MPSTFRVPNTNFYRAPQHADDLEAFGRWAADQIAVAIEDEGPDSVAAVFLEPVQNAGGCFPPPPGYFQRVREICDEYDVLLVSDEVICAFGRLGHMFGAERYDYLPDMITCAKGITSGYAPLGAMIATDRLFEPFGTGDTSFAHGYTFGGHPVSTAVAMANLDIFEREGINQHVLDKEPAFRATLEKLYDLPIVGDVRGAGYFYGIELVKDKHTKETFDDAESERLLRGFLSKALFDAGLYCRADDRGDPVVQLSPPLICDQEHFDEIEQILRDVLTRAEPADLNRDPPNDAPRAIPSPRRGFSTDSAAIRLSTIRRGRDCRPCLAVPNRPTLRSTTSRRRSSSSSRWTAGCRTPRSARPSDCPRRRCASASSGCSSTASCRSSR